MDDTRCGHLLFKLDVVDPLTITLFSQAGRINQRPAPFFRCFANCVLNGKENEIS
jgi:hypothetical protein